jgi:ABC-type polysaccharide/polyol phosphate transport system ATPase subunit
MKKQQKSQTSDIAISLTNVSKKYEIHHEKPTLVEQFVKGRNETFWALKDINLTIKKGEKVGIIGPNGSGKTTLLKIISGIATPTTGTVKTYGNVVSLIDLEAGFNPDLTGYQNIYLNGLLLGMTRKELDCALPEIIRFADIKQFIDAPLFTYSQGMKLRLGFAIAIHAHPNILILDENMSAGDEDFRKKSLAYMEKFFQEKKTILMVSHWVEFIGKHCNTILKLEHGRIVMPNVYV